MMSTSLLFYESLLTILTLIRLFTRVNHLVSTKGVVCCKPLVTVPALKWLLTFMHIIHMSAAAPFIDKSFLTNLTFKRPFFSRVGFFMDPQKSLGFKCFGTHSTFVWPFVCVNSFMAPQLTFFQKRFLHTRHSCGFSPVWEFSCLKHWFLKGNTSSQY